MELSCWPGDMSTHTHSHSDEVHSTVRTKVRVISKKPGEPRIHRLCISVSCLNKGHSDLSEVRFYTVLPGSRAHIRSLSSRHVAERGLSSRHVAERGIERTRVQRKLGEQTKVTGAAPGVSPNFAGDK